ncbi:ribosome small subunit-dependent GTPase A [Timonella sp. A28]|uniref:ribosome small subunit-dependent GTPase A n=1 Tax=Timonella sp. A28 TaxID=3442640 RepID=UPI003EBB1D69
MTDRIIANLGWDEERAQDWQQNPLSATGAFFGRVVRVERTTIHIAHEAGLHTVMATGFAVGDWVATDGETWVSLLPRRTQLSRQSSDRTSAEQILAANIDAVFVIEPVHPTPNLRRVERMLTLAWASGARPIVVLTKHDLAEQDFVPDIEAVAHGVEVFAVSSTTGHNLSAVTALIHPGQTFVFLGPSGAGKSSLVNALAGHDILATADVRGDGRGRHTTTRRELITIDGLGCIIDTPGIRAVGMTAHTHGLNATFDDILDLAQHCRFTDCAHASEPGCAVTEAVAHSQLDPARLDNYKRIEREIAHHTRRKETHSRAEERVETKSRRTAKRVIMKAKGRDSER